MNKNAYIISGILVVALIVFGLAYFGGPKSSSPTQPEVTTVTTAPSVEKKVNIGLNQGTSSATANTTDVMMKAPITVTYTDDGFTPGTVTINSGETVKWVNQSSKPMWVASNPHPVHTDYAGLDELKSATKDETYSFTFTKAGTWKYHNHKAPRDGGVVVVK